MPTLHALLLAPILLLADGQTFKVAWQSAGNDVIAQMEALDHLRGGDAAEAKILLKLTLSPDLHWQVTDKALALLRELGTDGILHLIKELGSSRADPEKVIIARALEGIPGPGPERALAGALGDKAWEVRAQAAQALGRHTRHAVVDTLIARLKKEDDPRVGADIVASLRRLTNQRQLADAADWESWWNAQRDGFDFAHPPADQAESDSKRTVSRLQNLYKEIESRRVIFVIDASGSMQVRASGDAFQGKSRLDYVKLELSQVIEQELAKGCRFNLLVFSDEARAWQKSLQSATDGAKEKAKSFVQGLVCDKQDARTPWQAGATNSHAALMLALDDAAVDTIYFLSDGSPTVGKTIDFVEILGEVRKKNLTRNVKIHAIAFLSGEGSSYGVVEDKPSARKFMERLAQENGGTYTLAE